MVSLTAQSERRRAIRLNRAGRKSAALREKHGSTPKFPVHPEGYDPHAADAKPTAQSK